MQPVPVGWKLADIKEFRIALMKAGYNTVLAFAKATKLDKNKVYRLVRGGVIDPATMNKIMSFVEEDFRIVPEYGDSLCPK
jgi:ATP-dependent RNA circularization protein (DNA/RNA ligase family)